MGLLKIDVTELPAEPLDAAAEFHARELPEIRDDSGIHSELDLVIVFEPAGHDHRAWRLAAIQELARELAPRRINALVGADEAAIHEAMRYLDSAPGVTGQLLAVEPV